MKSPIIKPILFTLLFLQLSSCTEDSPKEDTSITVDTTNYETSLADSTSKSRVQEIIADGMAIIDAKNELLERKRKNDSIRLSRREKMFAYQLGLPLKNEKLLMEAFEKLSDPTSVYALKKSNTEYLLVKFEDKSEEDLDTELDAYKAEHADEVIGSIKKIDLVRECGKKKMPVLAGKIKKRKNDTQIDCLICDN
ncbi:MAG: hypothetical protein IT236_18360 [Bacteroidia bacterium]|nr:hypothetical protein [Bacteroidia bacterium]